MQFYRNSYVTSISRRMVNSNDFKGSDRGPRMWILCSSDKSSKLTGEFISAV